VRRAVILALIAGICLLPLPAQTMAQQPPVSSPAPESLTVTGNVPGDRFIDRHTTIEFSLSRPLLPNEGEIALLIGAVDVSDLLERSATRVAYRPRITPLPVGERELIVYRRAEGRWVELQRFALKVLRRGGLVRVSLAPTATLGNNGQLAAGRSAGVPTPPRVTFQDFTLASGVRSSHEGLSWTLETQSNVVGASRREQALRFGQRGQDAPRVDLSDYLITLRTRQARVSIGHVAVGSHRYLVNAFGSRGITLGTDLGPATVSLGAVNGSSVVGWNHLIGLEQRDHRVVSAALGADLVRRRPGALRMDVSLLDGSLLPQTSFTQGAVVDAERSSGAGMQLSAEMAGQRVRLRAGYARSRFSNPARDPQLLGDSTIRRVRPETRAARYVEVTLAVLQGARTPLLGLASITTAYRHERVDPLYRSVAVSTQSDQQQNALDVNGSVGPIAGQLSFARSHDNLDAVPSVLRSLNRQANASVTLALPSISRLRRLARFLPALAYTSGRTHELAAGTPTNGDFRPSDLPDQLSNTHNAEAQWQAGRWHMGYRFGVSDQDNRQAQRERADFNVQTHGLTLGLALGAAADMSADASAERQHAAERDETSFVRRLGVGVTWRPRQASAVVATMNTVFSHDASRPKGSRNGEMRFELSQGVFPSAGASSRGQLFLRYALTTAHLPNLDITGSALGTRAEQRQWTLSSGLSVRLF
jgi:hypothetical protein